LEGRRSDIDSTQYNVMEQLMVVPKGEHERCFFVHAEGAYFEED
jgi:hypothetical protein